MATKSKKALAYIKLQVKAGEANPAPPIGPALSQHGLNIMDFCKKFNLQSQDTEKGTILPVVISVYKDKSFSFIIKTPPVAVLLKKIAGIAAGSAEPHSNKVASISKEKLLEVAQIKHKDLSHLEIDSVVLMVAGTARSMGITIKE